MSLKDINVAGRISHFFAVNRPLSILLLVVALLFGLLSFFLTPKQYNPEIVRPAFSIAIEYNGATQAAAIDLVVYELVEKVSMIPGVDDIYTQVQDGAHIFTTVIFEVGYDATKAKLDLFAQLEQHSYLARGNMQLPHIQEINPETIPVLQLVFGSEELSLPALREKVVALSRQLGSVPEVSEQRVYGGYVEALVIEIDAPALAAAGITVDSLVETIQQNQTRVLSVGVQDKPHVVEVVFDGQVASPAEVGALVITPGVQVRDVARVYMGVAGNRSYVFHEQADVRGEVVMLSVAKREGSSAPVVTKAYLQALDEKLTTDAFSKLSYTVVSNDGVIATNEIFGLTKNLITSIAIVLLVLVLFLSTRAALVVLVAIPVTFLVVFGLGLLFGETINRITLFALILSLGLLVDSAIVAVENMYSHVRRWQQEPNEKTKEQVIATAIDEIGVGLLLSTITSVIVFLPMNFITGMMRPYMGPISFFVPVALIVSFLVAIVVTPFIASHVLLIEDEPNVLTKVFSNGIEKVSTVYTRLLRAILHSKKRQQFILQGALGLFLVSLILPLIGLVHFQMLPRADRDQFYVYIDLPIGTDRETTREITAQVSQVMQSHDSVVSTQQFVATAPAIDFNGMFKGAQHRVGSEQATIRVNVIPTTERKESSTDIVTTLRAEVQSLLPEIAPAVRFIEEPPGPPVQATLVAKVVGANAEEQRQAAVDLQNFIGTIDGVVDTYVSDEAMIGRVRYDFDYAAASELGISSKQVAAIMQMLEGSYEVTELLGGTGKEYTPIILSISQELRRTPNFIDSVTVTTEQGLIVPLRSVLSVTHELRPTAVYFERGEQLSYVTAEVEERSIVYVVIEIMRELSKGMLSGYTVTDWNLFGLKLETAQGSVVSLSWGGEWEMTVENFRDLGMAMGVALLLVYALLVAQYNRFSTPAFILVTVPLGLIGILWGFLLLDQGFGIYLTATALIGFIALIGIVVNNAIIFLEYVEQVRRAGFSQPEALLAAGEARLRPILLTSLTTVLGSLTIASDPVWSGLAWAIVFGLSLSTILTLVIYPTLLVRFGADDESLIKK